MDLEIVKKVISDQLEEVELILNDQTLIERDVNDPSGFLKKPNILAILGVRRSGKSTYALKVANCIGKFGYANMDDERLYGMPSSQLNLLLEAWIEVLGEEPDLIVLDEIQNIKGWELFVNRMRRTKRVIITGSNANLLEGELSTHLTGRYIDIRMFPFSFIEFLRFFEIDVESINVNSTSTSSTLRSKLEEYMVSGGFPESITIGGNILARIYKDIILKDAILRFKIRNRKAFNEVSRYLISNYSREFTFSRVARVCGITSNNMVSEFAGILEEVGLYFHLERYSKKLSEQYNSPKKSYCVDNGIIDAIGFNISENRGLLMENLVALELRRRISNLDSDNQIYYWKDHSGKEVDFLLRRNRKIEELIQVTYSLKDELVQKREVLALLDASKNTGCENLKIITWNEEKKLEYDKQHIMVIPLYKWLIS